MIHSITIRHDRVKAGHAGIDTAGEGGTVTEAGGKRIHTFAASGNFTVVNRGAFQYLIVAGGGGGANGTGGGGGAGGMLTGTTGILEPGVFPVVVGTGGPGAPAGTGVAIAPGTNGNNSSFNGKVAIGGGAGAPGNLVAQGGGNGGSGGGVGNYDHLGAHTGGTGTGGQGNNGGDGNSGAPNYPGGGGGGAGAVGANSTTTAGGAGGAGSASSISGASVTHAGGGGGGTEAGGTAGTGGAGGGGAGSNNSGVDATDATDGLGGGGGGGAVNAAHSVLSAGGDGGDGIVIIAYDIPGAIDERQAGFTLNLVEENQPGFIDASFSEFLPEEHAEGGLYSCRFKVRSRETVLKEMFERGLGRWIEAWGYGLEPEFEGMIVEITYNLPPDRFTISLEPMVNKGIMRADVDGDGTVDRSTLLQNTTSQEQYVISQLVLGGGEVQGNPVADQTVQQYLDLRAFPRPSMTLGGGTGEEYLEIFARGFSWTLTRPIYNQTAITGTQSLSSEVRDILVDQGEYVGSQRREANTTVVARVLDADRRPWDLIVDMTKLGDANSNRWLPQMYGRRCTTAVGRAFILKQAAPPVVPPTI